MRNANTYSLRKLMVFLLIGCLLLSAGCTPKPESPTQPPETTPVKETLPAQTDPTEPVDPEISLVLFRQAMVETPQAFAAAYFGFHYNADSDDPVDPRAVMAAEASQMCTDLPFLQAIPQERVIGGGMGELYCIVPRDEDATVAVNRGVWDDARNGFIYEDVIYRSDSGDPIVVFCNSDGWEPDTQVTITCSDGSVVTWYPRICDLGSIEPLRNDQMQDLLWDFSPYGESLALDYREMAAEGWVHPVEADLIGTTWGCYTYLENNQKAVHQVTFREGTCDVRWYDGYSEKDQEHLNAPWELIRAGDFTILSINFQGLTGVLRYNLLLEKTDNLLFTIPDASEGYVAAGWEPLQRILEPIPQGPDPAGMIGTWELAWTEVEGDRNEAVPGRLTIVITEGASADSFNISMTDTAIPELSFKNKELTVHPGGLYSGCGNEAWTAQVDFVGLYDTIYSMTLLPDGTLLVQDYWEFDGMPMVSYGWYNRAG